MTKTLSLDFRIDTKSMVATFWADLAITAIRQLGVTGDAAGPAMHRGLQEIGFFDSERTDVEACKQFEEGWDKASSLFDGRFSRRAPPPMRDD